MVSRATHMQLLDVALLNDWARNLRDMFHGQTPHLVGSALTKSDYRDVNVRLILADDDHAKLASCVNIDRLNLCLSLWGRQATLELPIDCQLQQMTTANAEYDGVRRAIGRTR